MAVKFLDVNQKFIEMMNQYRLVPTGTPLIKACSESPVVFAEKMLGIRPYAWQVYAMNEWAQALTDRTRKDNKSYVVLSSRQIGKSTAVAIFGLWAAIFNKYPYGISNNTMVGIVSASDDQAKKLLDEVNKMIHIGDSYMLDTYQKDGTPVYGKKFFSDLLDAGEANNTKTITFKKYNKAVHGQYLLAGTRTGSAFKSFPPTGVVLGETFSLIIIDEAGKNDRISDQFYLDYIYPTGNKPNALRLYLSTPWEPVGFFYEMVDPDGTIGSKANVIAFTVDAIALDDPVNYASVKHDIDEFISKGKVDEVQRGYYCQFVKGELSYFEPDKIRSIFVEDYSMLLSSKEPVDMGLDFGGKTTSKTVITLSGLSSDGIIRRLYKRVYDVQRDETLLDDISQLFKDFNIQRIIPDNCPQGHYIIKEMVRRGWNVQPTDGKDNHGMQFKTDKVKKYGAFRSMLNNKKVRSFNDESLKTEMLALQFGNGAKNSVINHAAGFSDDEIDSFVMSCYFFLQEDVGVKTYEPKTSSKIFHSTSLSYSPFGSASRLRPASEE